MEENLNKSGRVEDEVCDLTDFETEYNLMLEKIDEVLERLNLNA
jgi:hypothetical protein